MYSSEEFGMFILFPLEFRDHYVFIFLFSQSVLGDQNSNTLDMFVPQGVLNVIYKDFFFIMSSNSKSLINGRCVKTLHIRTDS